MSGLPKCDEIRAAANTNNWTDMMIYYCRTAAIEDVQLARKVNILTQELARLNRERAAVIQEMATVRKKVPQKTVEFLKQEQALSEHKVMQMNILAGELELSARNKNFFIHKLEGTLPL